MVDEFTRAYRERTYALERKTEEQKETNKQLAGIKASIDRTNEHIRQSAERAELEAVKTRIAQEKALEEQRKQTVLIEQRNRYIVAQHRITEYRENYFSIYGKHDEIRQQVHVFLRNSDNSIESKNKLLDEVKEIQKEDSQFLLPICMESLLEFELGNFEASKTAQEKSYSINFKYASLFYTLCYLSRGNQQKSWEAFNDYFSRRGPFELSQYHELLIELYLSDYYTNVDKLSFENKLREFIEVFDTTVAGKNKGYDFIIYDDGEIDSSLDALKKYDSNYGEINRILRYNDILKYQAEHFSELLDTQNDQLIKLNKLQETLNWLVSMPVNYDEKNRKDNMYYEESVIRHGGDESLATGAPYNFSYSEDRTDVLTILVNVYGKNKIFKENLLIQKRIINLLKEPCLRTMNEVCDRQRIKVNSVRNLKLKEFEQQIDLYDDLKLIKPEIKKRISKLRKFKVSSIFREYILLMLGILPFFIIFQKIFGERSIFNYLSFVCYFIIRFVFAKRKSEKRLDEDLSVIKACQEEFKTFEEEQNRLSAKSVNILERLSKV